MSKKLVVALIVLLIAGSAPAIVVTTLDFYDDADLIASELGFTYSLPEGGLADYWPEEVESIEDLPIVVAVINDPPKVVVPGRQTFGDDFDCKKGDFVVLKAREGGFGATFYSRGAEWTNTSISATLKEHGWTKAFFDVWAEISVGSGFKSVTLPHRDGMLLLAKVTDPNKFAAGFTGEGEVAKGQLMMLKAGISGTTARFIHAARLPMGVVEVDAGRVTITTEE